MTDSSQQVRMQRGAVAAVRRWPALDGTLESLDLVDDLAKGGGISDEELQLLGAYLGELVRAASGTGRWRVGRFRLESASGPDGVLKFKHWEFDPYEVLQTLEGPLAEQIDEVITFGEAPSRRTVRALGWRSVLIVDDDPPGAWTAMRQDLRFVRARLTDWWRRRREQRAQAR